MCTEKKNKIEQGHSMYITKTSYLFKNLYKKKLDESFNTYFFVVAHYMDIKYIPF